MRKLLVSLFILFSFCIFAEEYQITYLASFPRSGNHWMRYLIEDYTGVASASVYQDEIPPHPILLEYGYLAQNGYEGNRRYALPGEKVLIKTHYPAGERTQYDFKPNAKYLRIVRNPIDSFYSWKVRFNISYFSKEIMDSLVISYRSFQRFWDAGKMNCLTIRYEDMLENPKETFLKVLEFLEYPIDEAKVDETLKKYPPKNKEFVHLHAYTPGQIVYIRRNLKDILDNFNYNLDDLEFRN